MTLIPLIKKGMEVTLITASYSHVPKRNYPIKDRFHFENELDLNLVIVKNIVYESGRSIKRILSMLIFWLKLYQLPVRAMKAPDYILVSSISLLPILNAYYWKRKLKNKPKIILEIRDIWPLSLIELGSFSKYNPFVWFLAKVEKMGYRKSDYLTSVLPLAYKHFEEVAGREVNFKHISNGIAPTSSLQLEKIDESLEAIIPKNKFIVGYAGSIGEANAMEYLIRTARLIKNENIHFLIVGDGHRKADLVKEAEGLSNVTFYGFIPKVQVPDLLSRCDLLFLGSRDSTLYKFGVSANKIFDYMLAGKPVFMTGFVPENEIEISGCGELIKPDDPEAIKSTILKFYTLSSNEREALGKKGKEFVLKNRTYESLSHKYIEVFIELDGVKTKVC
jgi:glycosyltransferase involved in cell wall biosynthesis